jgi:hypothetical protein
MVENVCSKKQTIIFSTQVSMNVDAQNESSLDLHYLFKERTHMRARFTVIPVGDNVAIGIASLALVAEYPSNCTCRTSILYESVVCRSHEDDPK